ncbi:recombinase family protein [Saccharopolyspora mangrovi]|uniref:Recombinase family protein n=1 Tax=Saccharopolyspora mangrovi TaxID=3082379 RepID=A0ABU6ALJ4_9PSEU|nr:recombinase family protein [Saccharopolyspora sp. S2-29]MEB3372417.1 recombinase family protein [Saccharopolyspora sp. S2-29]
MGIGLLMWARVRLRSIAGIARELNDRGVVCPSGADPERNRHRSGRAWRTLTVAGILENPRYTGRQVWNRTGTVQGPGAARGAGGAGRRTNAGEWAVSDAPAHAALVDEEMFRSVQGIRAARRSQDGGTRTYLFAGLVVCGACDRRFDSHWAHNRAGYRCRHGRTSARAEAPGLKSVYVREEHLLEGLRSRLAGLTGGGDEDVVDYLRANGLVIVYLGPDWENEELPSEAALAAPQASASGVLTDASVRCSWGLGVVEVPGAGAA